MQQCEGFSNLDGFEQSEYLAKLIHVVRYDQEQFKLGEIAIRKGESSGLFSGVKFGRDAVKEFGTENIVKDY